MAVASSLPTDLLLEIFLLLREEPTDIIRCAGVCKPWRRAIIGNATSFQRRPDRFDPRLLLGVFHSAGKYEARLWRTPGPFQSALPSDVVGRIGGYETARSLIPDPPASAAGGAGFLFDSGLYRELLWSADGFILLMARAVNRLCLFNPITGDCTFLPAAASKCSAAYVLLAGTGNKLAVRILAVQKRERFMFSKEDEGGLSYQVLDGNADAAVWGPVQRSTGDESSEQGGRLSVCMERRTTLVCRDTVYWLAGPREDSITCALALDVRTGRTWTTELPLHHQRSRAYPGSSPPILAISDDGRLSLIESLLPGPRIHVWVAARDAAWWTLQETMLLRPHCRDYVSLSAFCPRSGCVVGVCLGREVLIDIHGDSPPRVIGERRGYDDDCHPYEMDCSSTFYISKMKQF